MASEHNNYSLDFYSVDASAQGGVTEYDNGSQEYLHIRSGGGTAATGDNNGKINVPSIV